MALGAPQLLTKAGVAPTYNTPLATENVSVTTAPLIVDVKNANAAACTVTLVDPGLTPGGSAAINPTVVVPATTGNMVILVPVQFVNNGVVQLLFSIQTSVTAALFVIT